MTQRRILIVDDYTAIGEILQRTLTSRECLVDRAADGAEALALFKEQRYDLIITDLQMPDMGGLALIEAIRTLYAQTPFIIISARTDQITKPPENTQVLPKPFRLEAINAAIVKLLDR